MTETLETDLTAVRIRHLGQCPHEKGHESYGSVIFQTAIAALIFGNMFIAFISYLADVPTVSKREKEAIQRGFATRDPITYDFKWVRQ